MSAPNAKVLIVDDDGGVRAFLTTVIKGEGFKPLEARDGEKALEVVKSESPDLMLLDIRLPDISGMEVLRLAKEIDPKLSVIVLTGYSDTPGAVSAMKAGAFDYLSKPFEVKDIVRAIRQALEERKHQLEIKEPVVQRRDPLEEEMGPSDAVKKTLSEVTKVAGSDFSVIILGETGSGKELIARAIHGASSRSRAPFVAVDCGAIPETLLESELFGHEKGAFTGAESQKPGKFELAQGGTLFLDEISNMPPGSQAKLLRVLQEKKVYRVGGTKAIEIDVRLLVASNQDLHELSESGSFRKDLFYRLNEFTITVCPLRERKEDIPYLAKRFLDLANLELRKEVRGFSETALDALLSFPWPGNVRQLRSMIRRATLLADEVITEKQLDLKGVPASEVEPISGPRGGGIPWRGLSLQEIVQRGVMALEREVLTEVLKHTGGNKSKAARLLKIDYKTIHTKVKKLGITAGGELNDQSNGKNNEEESLGSEQTESPEVFDLSFASQPNSLGTDTPEEKVKQRRLASAA
jgi:DNA-binding NtrC family response regulator